MSVEEVYWRWRCEDEPREPPDPDPLTPKQIGEYFGLGEDSEDSVNSWLEELGLQETDEGRDDEGRLIWTPTKLGDKYAKGSEDGELRWFPSIIKLLKDDMDDR